MKKRIFIILLTLCLAVAAMTVAVMAETFGDFIYTSDDSTATITGYTNFGAREVAIPETLGGYTVVGIDSDAFAGIENLSTVIIPSSVTHIGSHAFTDTALTSVTLSCGTSYEDNSFPSNCTITISAHTYVNHVCSVCGSLDCIAYGDGWVLANDGTLSFSSYNGMEDWVDTARATYCEEVKSVVFYDGTDYIPNYAFKGCSNLSSINIPGTVTSIGDEAFYGCSSLTTVTIPSSVEEIGINAFTSCPGLRSLVIENCGLEFDAGAQQVDESIVSQPAHTYSGGECTVCGHKDSDYVIVGSAELHDGYYTVDGTNVVSGDPTADSNIASYAYYSNGVLYLYDFSYTGTGGTQSSNAVIKPNSGSLTVSLSGSSTIGGEGYGFYSNVGSITFKSTSDTEQGILTVSAYVNTIYGSSSSEIVIDNVIIKSSGANIYSGISTTIKNGANIEASGISSGNMITISYSTVVVESTGTAMVAGGLYIIASEITLNGKLQVGEGTINPATNGTWQIDYGTSATDCQSMTYSSELSIADEKNNRNWDSCTYFRIAEHVHTYTSEVTKEATCTSTGTTTYTCTLCNNSYEETIKKVAHTVVTDEAVAATCTETGLTEGSHCSVCSEVIVAQEVVAATGHSYTVSWSWDGTSAMATVSCSDCGDSYEQQAAITTQSNYGQTIYIAIVRVGDVTYTTSKTTGTITIPTTDSTSEVTTEEVETEEPVEGTDTETEPNEEAEAETNPTTGIVVALLPMAMAVATAVASKQKLR